MGKIAKWIRRRTATAFNKVAAGVHRKKINPGATSNPFTVGEPVYNPANNNLPHLNACIEQLKKGGGKDCLIIWVGSSTVSGSNSAGTGKGNGYSNTNTLEPLFAKALTEQYGIPADAHAVFGFPARQENRTGHSGDPRISAGRGWEQDTITSIGGPMFANSSTTAPLTFTLPATADTETFYYPTDNIDTLGTFTYQINNGPVTTINQGAAAPGIASVTITGITPGENNKLILRRTSGTVKLIGQVSSCSTAPAIHVINSGVGGWIAGDWDDRSGKPYASNQAWAALSPAAVFIHMSNNDAVRGTPDNVYKEKMTKIINGAGPQADVVLIGQLPFGRAAGNINALPKKIAVERQLAEEFNIPFIDQTKYIPSYDRTPDGNNGTDLGFVSGDGFHASPAGYRDQAAFLVKKVMEVAGIEKKKTSMKGPKAG